MTISQLIHGPQAQVETVSGVVDSQHVDRLSVPACRPARSALSRVPSTDGRRSSDKGEVLDIALLLPAVLPDEPIDAVRARDAGKGTGGVIVAGVV